MLDQESMILSMVLQRMNSFGTDSKLSLVFQFIASASHWNFDFFGFTYGSPKKLKISVLSTGTSLKKLASLFILTKNAFFAKPDPEIYNWFLFPNDKNLEEQS